MGSINYKIIILLMFAFLGCSRGSGDRTGNISSTMDIGKIKLTELDGTAIDLTQYKGKAVFVNFWATWCKPCIMEMPTIAGLQEKVKDENIVFLFASNEDVGEIKQFGEKRGFNFHYVHLENMEVLNIQALPTTFIFSPEGKLKFSEAGYQTWDSNENIELIKKIIPDHE